MPTADLIINAKLIRLFQDKPCIGSQSISLKYHHFGFVKLKHNTGYTVYKLKLRKLLNHMTRLVVHMHCTPWVCPWRCKLQLSRCHASMGLYDQKPSCSEDSSLGYVMLLLLPTPPLLNCIVDTICTTMDYHGPIFTAAKARRFRSST